MGWSDPVYDDSDENEETDNTNTEKDNSQNDEKEPQAKKEKKIVVRLSPNRQIEINFMQEDLFYSPSGTPINAKQYIKSYLMIFTSFLRMRKVLETFG